MTSLPHIDLATVVERVQAATLVVRSETGGGAGTAWSDTLVVTNHHVVPRGRAHVLSSGGRGIEAIVVARDEENDLALLRIEGLGAQPLPLGPEQDDARPGEIALAVGHPWGQRGAVTWGVVSGASISSWRGTRRSLVRADIRLGPGNSGGPLADAAGRLLGINAMVDGGMALAVPAAVVERFVAEALGRIARPEVEAA